MARPRKYTARKLRRAVDQYFDSLRYEQPMMREVWRGDMDGMGHKVMVQEQIVTLDGQPAVLIAWLQLPSLTELQLQLGINRSTWARWAEDEELGPVVEYARSVVEAALEQQLPHAKGQGIIFNLTHNFGWKDKQEIQITGGVEQFLRGLEEQGGGQSF